MCNFWKDQNENKSLYDSSPYEEYSALYLDAVYNFLRYWINTKMK